MGLATGGQVERGLFVRYGDGTPEKFIPAPPPKYDYQPDESCIDYVERRTWRWFGWFRK